MAFDAMPDGDPWGPMCRSCKRPIGKNEPMTEVRFEVDPERKLEDLNGPYHAQCAKPFLGLAAVINLKPFSF